MASLCSGWFGIHRLTQVTEMLSLLLAFVLSVPIRIEDQATEYVDLIETNHYFDHQGRLVYDQVVFYERTPTTGKFQVRAWCLVDDREYLNRRPVKNETTGLYQVDWYDTDKRILRKLTSRLFRESWSQVDPERDNKRFHPERLRVELVKKPEKPEIPVPSDLDGDE